MKGKWLEYTVDQFFIGITLEELLKDTLSISGRRIQKLTRSKGLYVNNKKSYLNKKLKEGDIVKVRIEESVTDKVKPQAMDLDIIYEDEWLLIVNKPAGLKVYQTNKEDNLTLANGIQYYYEDKGIVSGVHFVHRLDTNTSGAIMIAKNSYAHHLLAKQLTANQIKRQYLAIVDGELNELTGTIDLPIAKLASAVNRRTVHKTGDQAITNYAVVKQNKRFAVVEVTLETGKTHQIRVHFSHIGHPLIGDTLYGGPSNKTISRQALHSHKISWLDFENMQLRTVVAEIPNDIHELMNSIDLDS
ncbi:hypothetical protein BHF68_09655 [Desulfuribacillus alkaliarsenatis]|uniref:Pseudouridine synthase n=1 Tax=Desulfuribacillus alkaliarsenatis TaxID=766136 RepID=A0A1E5FZX7_9FIRM|nr:hypothetical protein BHF68_09655 [Desulfuribacillus alkaliarsenatis]